MDDNERRNAERNRGIRGFILRSLVNGYNNTLIQRQLENIMVNAGVIISPDISSHLEYLIESGYIKYTDDHIKAHSAYRDRAVIKLTKKGIDLIEGSIPNDPGIDL